MTKILGYKIASEVLKEPSLFPADPPELWLIMSEDFSTDDDLPHFYADEIPLLKDKTVAQLKEIYRVKKTFPGSKVRG